MQILTAKVLSVHAGANEDRSKPDLPSIRVEFDGVVGDKHRSYTRKTWAGDKQPRGAVRRNERQWSAVSLEELREISGALDLRHSLLASTLGANLCLQGIDEFSRLPKGTLLKFPSGAELCVEEYNPPCLDMGTRLAAKHETRGGERLSATAFSGAARLLRGLVGVVEVPGEILAGDEVTIELYEHPSWLRRSND
jgi:MOSC domain-containing protein YiiM